MRVDFHSTSSSPASDADVAGQDAIRFASLLRLRFGALLAQVATSIASVAMGLTLSVWPLVLVFVVTGSSNVMLWQAARRSKNIADQRGFASWRRHLMFGVLCLDVVLLTVLLLCTGGPINPFTFLYLVHVALATIVLPGRRAWWVALLAAGCYFGLFAVEDFLPPHNHAHMAMHVRGMWVAFVVTAIFITFFVTQLRGALDAHGVREQELVQLRMQRERLSALATLSAGAAHELSTPLATVALIASDIRAQLKRDEAPSLALLREDMGTIEMQVDRCRDVLLRLTADGGQMLGESSRSTPMAALVEHAHTHDRSLRRAYVSGDEAVAVVVPPRAFAFALHGILKNAWDAQARRVDITTERHGDRVTLVVSDDGSGITPDIAARVGDPFFSTKAQGQGMGLGVFFARSVVERAGGTLLLLPRANGGTTVRIDLPVAQVRT